MLGIVPGINNDIEIRPRVHKSCGKVSNDTRLSMILVLIMQEANMSSLALICNQGLTCNYLL